MSASNHREVTVPDLGDFENVDVVRVHVKHGDFVAKEDPLLTLETAKASMEIPAPVDGKVIAVHIAAGDKVSQGTPILRLEPGAAPPAEPWERGERPALDIQAGELQQLEAQVAVLGAGPGGYTAAFRSADLGKRTVLIERYPKLGGVCLNVGCIPSKALLHIARIVREVEEFAPRGLKFGKPNFDLKRMRQWTESVIARLGDGLTSLAKQRSVMTLQGTGRFSSANTLIVERDNETTQLRFENAIVAAGSRPSTLPGLPESPRIMDSTDALLLTDIPARMLIIGGGIIGLEMAAIYSALGARITVVELTKQLLPGCDRDILRPFEKHVKAQYESIQLATKVAEVAVNEGGLSVVLQTRDSRRTDVFDAALVATGRRPNGHEIGARNAGINVTEAGFIPVDGQQRTNVRHIFAIGDIAGEPQLAHKATHEGKVAAEVIAGLNSAFDARVIPLVAYTDPEIAWVGLTEAQAKEQGTEYATASFPWAANGRSLSFGRHEGLTKLMFDKASKKIIGMAAVGPHAGDLISEGVLAIEMGCDASDIGLSIHPHPTLAETIAMAAETFAGTITDLYVPR